jgi:general secretion pathway protein D
MTEPIEDEVEVNPQPEHIEPEIVIPEVLKQKASLTLNESLSVKSVLCETAKRLHIDFQIDPGINERIIFQARQKPFIEILDAISDMVNLRYTISDGFVKVVRDVPYTESYNIQFLNFSRDSENKISIATEVNSTASDLDEKNKGGSSDSTVTVRAKSDFWYELDDSIKVILNSQSREQATYSINRQSGIVTVYANSKTQRYIRDYIKKIKEATMSQVLIEAKIVEVVLKNEYRRGIDWDFVSKRSKLNAKFGTMLKSGFASSTNTPVTFSYNPSETSTEETDGATTGMPFVLNVLEEFGTVKTISNPRITAMNNQAAILKVAQNHVYFRLNYDKTYSNSEVKREGVTVSSEIKTVPIGFVMFVQPSIDTSSNTITLLLRPTITKLSSSVSDPAVDIAIRSIETENKEKYEPSKIPITEIREVTSVLRLNDGEIAVLGGFMEVRSSKMSAGIPGVQDIPYVGEIASAKGLGDTVVELVILIKVRIVGNQRHQRAADIRLLRCVPDPRPF